MKVRTTYLQMFAPAKEEVKDQLGQVVAGEPAGHAL
jgi:hypothetical protein